MVWFTPAKLQFTAVNSAHTPGLSADLEHVPDLRNQFHLCLLTEHKPRGTTLCCTNSVACWDITDNRGGVLLSRSAIPIGWSCWAAFLRHPRDTPALTCPNTGSPGGYNWWSSDQVGQLRELDDGITVGWWHWRHKWWVWITWRYICGVVVGMSADRKMLVAILTF